MRTFVLNHHSVEPTHPDAARSTDQLVALIEALSLIIPKVRAGHSLLDARFDDFAAKQIRADKSVQDCVVTELPQQRRLLWFLFSKNVGRTVGQEWSAAYQFKTQTFQFPELSVRHTLVSLGSSTIFAGSPLALTNAATLVTVLNVWDRLTAQATFPRYEWNPKHHPNARGDASVMDLNPSAAQKVLDCCLENLRSGRLYGCYKGSIYAFKHHHANRFHAYRLEDPRAEGLTTDFIDRLAAVHDAADHSEPPIWDQAA